LSDEKGKADPLWRGKGLDSPVHPIAVTNHRVGGQIKKTGDSAKFLCAEGKRRPCRKKYCGKGGNQRETRRDGSLARVKR